MSTTVHIVTSPDVLHGKPHIEGTRVGAFQVGEMVRESGHSIEDVARELTLDREQVDAAVEYYDEHPELMATLRAQREAGLHSIRERSRAD